jgi:flagella basal body P-ring formation protein FlgA
MATLNTLLRCIKACSALGLATFLVLAPLAWWPAQAQTPADRDDTQLSGSAVPVLQAFLRQQTNGLHGDVRIRLVQPQSGPLPECEPALLDAFLPTGTKPWGRVSVGVRCHAAQAWTRYVAAHIAVHGPYYVAARALAAGQLLSPADAERREGDLTALPTGVVQNLADMAGTLSSHPVASGAPLRRDLLRRPSLVLQGQAVKLVQRGQGFVSSAEGKALSSAAVGATVQVRMPGGQVLSGVVQADGTVARGS